jgi:hypothetical protein
MVSFVEAIAQLLFPLYLIGNLTSRRRFFPLLVGPLSISRIFRTWLGAAPSNGPEKRCIRAALKAKPEGAIVAEMVN